MSVDQIQAQKIRTAYQEPAQQKDTANISELH